MVMEALVCYFGQTKLETTDKMPAIYTIVLFAENSLSDEMLRYDVILS